MQALTFDRFGGPDVLSLSDVATPAARKGHLLVRVHAVSVNPLDGKIRRGELRLLSGSHFPRSPGLDFAGVVEEVGPGVRGFTPGQRVFGYLGTMREGTLAEHISVPARVVARMPAGLTFVGAASLAVGGLAALQALRDVARVKAGDRVLVNGSTGGVGLYALQLARRMGAHVTAVAGSAGAVVAQDYGAHVVLDYHRGPVSASGLTFDAVLELSARLPFSAARGLLGPRGVYVGFEPTPPALLSAALLNPFRGQRHAFAMTKATPADLEALGRQLDAGELRLAPTQVFALSDMHRAYALAERGGLVGKVVLQLR